jgi:glycosyltransferase involved in cell wall biosynthesis
MRKKLLFVINQLYIGGAETSLVNLMASLDPAQYAIDLLVLGQSPVEGAVSLLGRVPEWVAVCDAHAKYQKLSVRERRKGKLLCHAHDKTRFYLPALLFVLHKRYDWAFHVGEWWEPAFVAECVSASVKAAWIHSDVARAAYFDGEAFFRHDGCFRFYIFASELSRKSCAERFKFMEGKSVCVYNITDARRVRALSEAPLQDGQAQRLSKGIPILLTCANLRREKNHLRQVEAMSMLKQRGADFFWLNIGSTADSLLRRQVMERAGRAGLAGRFLLLGPKENPYPYMKMADAIAVLSDHESWSMVIAEAKALGIPVIATKTSGALEQLEHGETGILCDFSAEDIARQIGRFLSDKALRGKIRASIQNFDQTPAVLASFDALVRGAGAPKTAEAGEILYVIDDVNYLGGAHIATKLQIQDLIGQGRGVTIFSAATPSLETREAYCGARFIGWRHCAENQLYNRRLLDCLTDRALPANQKYYRLKISLGRRVLKKDFNALVLPHLASVFSEYGTVCVMSESSSFRQVAAASRCRRKIQWIHTDYCAWRNTSGYWKEVSKNDGEIYKAFDKIVLLTEKLKESFAELYPHLRGKLVANGNLIPVDEIRLKSERQPKPFAPVSFVTVARVDYAKALDRLFLVLRRLYEEGYRFAWTFIGAGEALAHARQLFGDSPLNGCVRFMGEMSNPFPLVKKADVFALLSRYEGLPNTIYEALVLGVPVIATDVGGTSEQVASGETGWLVPNDENGICDGLRHVLEHQEEIQAFRRNLRGYSYDNARVKKTNAEEIFG